MERLVRNASFFGHALENLMISNFMRRGDLRGFHASRARPPPQPNDANGREKVYPRFSLAMETMLIPLLLD
jgi:hypothetical protein